MLFPEMPVTGRLQKLRGLAHGTREQTAGRKPRAISVLSRTVPREEPSKTLSEVALFASLSIVCRLSSLLQIMPCEVREEGSRACRIPRMKNTGYLAKVWTQPAFPLIPLKCGVAPRLSSEFRPDSVWHSYGPSGPQGQP